MEMSFKLLKSLNDSIKVTPDIFKVDMDFYQEEEVSRDYEEK